MKHNISILVLKKNEMICNPNLCEDLLITVYQLVEVFTNLLKAKDPFIEIHSKIVAATSYMLAKALGVPSRGTDLVRIAGYLHDIGKIFIPDNILKKPGPLTSEEYELVKTHPVRGAELVGKIKIFQGKGGVVDMIKHHHERWDGKGYPSKLKKEEIPLGARIIAVADAFSAMICERPYRKAISLEVACDEIKRGSGTQFDPMIVKVFINIYNQIISQIVSILDKNSV